MHVASINLPSSTRQRGVFRPHSTGEPGGVNPRILRRKRHLTPATTKNQERITKNDLRILCHECILTPPSNESIVAWALARAFLNHVSPTRERMIVHSVSPGEPGGVNPRMLWCERRGIVHPSNNFSRGMNNDVPLLRSLRRSSVFDDFATKDHSARQSLPMKIPFFISSYDKIWLESPRQSCLDLRHKKNTTEFSEMPHTMNSDDVLCKNVMHQPDLKQSAGFSPVNKLSHVYPLGKNR